MTLLTYSSGSRQLRSATAELTLHAALATLATLDARPFSVIAWSAAEVITARLGPDGTLSGPGSRSPDLSDCFEAKAFNHCCELRWLHREEGVGTAVLLNDPEDGLVSWPAGWQALDDVAAAGAIDGVTYLCWGRAVPLDDWVALDEARVPIIRLPVEGVPRGARVQLLAREYVGLMASGAGTRGQAAVVEERLLGWRVE